MQYTIQSRLKQGDYFWLASVLIFITVIRRELNHLPDLFINEKLLWLSHNYDWWEDFFLLVIYLLLLGCLIYAWRYFWSVLKSTPVWLYLCVAALALLQYTGENAIVFPATLGAMVEELSETAIYLIALSYLWSVRLNDFEVQTEQSLELKEAIS